MPGEDTDSKAPASGDESAAFAEAVRGARRLAGGIPRLGPGLASTNARPRAPAPGLPLRRAGQLVYAVEEHGESWSARADGVDRRVWRKLRTGSMPREAQVDLHGLNRARALQALNRFMESARTAGDRRLLVVHGRGLHSGPEGPALREIVRESLTSGLREGAVLACCTAPPEMGGAGATLVLLRR